MSQFHTLTIQAVEKITDKAVRIAFNIPENLKADYQFTAGQYITLKTTLDGESMRRDYSICSAPKSGQLQVAVKEVYNGQFSKYANNALKAGDSIEVSAPQGRFTFTSDPSAKRTLALVAAGSGITPVMSILKTILTEEPNSEVVLIYGNKAPKDTMFLNELLELKAEYPNALHLQFVYSQSQELDALFGRIERSTINFVFKNKFKDRVVEAYYLCGPEGMINTVKEVLVENGIAESKIKYELFTAPVQAETTTIVADGQTEITVIVDDEETAFTMPQTQTVLEAALKNGVDAPYSCQGGICSSCLARLKEGTATMRQNNILTDGEVEEGLILTCQAQPTSPKVVVDYDDI